MWRIAILILVTLAVSVPALAKPKKPYQNLTAQDAFKERPDMKREKAFSPAERNLIRAQLQKQERKTSQKKPKGLPPGLQKKLARGKALPPGWQKKIEPGQSLDYQVYRQGESLPDVLLRRLPPPPVGSEILQVEDKILRLNSATRTILDVFDLTPTN